MSRTDKTAPFAVKYHYDPMYLEESHDHTDGVCDLPPRPRVGEDPWGWYKPRSPRCHWWPSFYFWRSRWAKCSCPMCGYDAYCSITRNKRERIEGRRYCRDGWMDEY